MGDGMIRREARRARRERMLGRGAVCAECGWRDVHALQRVGGRNLCYECMLAQQGKATIERHHVIGRHNAPTTIGVPGNQHRRLSDRQRDWPPETWRNTQGDPALRLAAMCRSLKDHLECWVEWLDGIARWLEAASAALAKRLGATWWKELDLPPLSPESEDPR